MYSIVCACVKCENIDNTCKQNLHTSTHDIYTHTHTCFENQPFFISNSFRLKKILMANNNAFDSK